MKIKTTTNFIDSARDINTLQITKSVYYIATSNVTYKANILDDVMKLWKDSNDTSEVLDVGRIG
jgi:hypothetical protein